MNKTGVIRPAASASPDPAEMRQRVRITYEKGDTIKFISHQDEFRAWERTLRRADLPLLYKQGFNPQPHIQFASPLGVGFTGARELIDITFSPPIPLPELYQRVAESLPPGLAIHAIEETALKGPALQSLLIGADYSIIVYATRDEISDQEIALRIRHFLDTGEHWRTRERKGKAYRYNLRPLVFELDYRGYRPDKEEHHIFLRVQQRPGATGRPDEVVSALGLDVFARSLRRDRLYFESNPDDVELFSRYPVIAKEDISQTLAVPQPRRRRTKTNKPRGRSISERAADEFA